MLNIEKQETLPYTGNRFYDNISEEDFRKAYELRSQIPLENISVGSKYYIYRAARLDTGELVFQKILAGVMNRTEDTIIYIHYGTYTEGKAKIFDMSNGYGENWFVIATEEDVKN